MKVRAQIGMVLNLDKCIGCHTCSVTCKNVWTSRDGVEYAWFNNVETKPGIGYPKDWENQKSWNGGWERTKAASSNQAWAPSGGSWRTSFANPDLPEIDDYYEPFDFDYDHLKSARKCRHSRPHGRVRKSRASGWRRSNGAQTGKKSWAVSSQSARRLQLRRHPEGDLRRVREYLHDVSAASVRTLPEPDLRASARPARSTSAKKTALS